MFKAVISDLDGTLLNSQHQLSALTLSTLRTLSDRGVRIILASGRHMLDMRGIREMLGFECELITSNGALVADAADSTLFQQMLPSALADNLLGIAAPGCGDFDINVYLKDGWYVQREQPSLLAAHKHTGFRYTVTEFAQLDRGAIHKIFFKGTPSVLRELESGLDAHSDHASIVWTCDDSFEVMARGVNKGAAAKATLARHGLTLADAVAFGDAMNDFEMLSMVGRGFVMANAMEELKRRLPDNPRAGHCNEDGVAQRLIELFEL
ncbi:Cof-type HAD-IIB family hydrolase [Niveibacterium sp. SC-1]|uniref:Cof-type HAD-IIB family hydrolase n=1 Tax=Niveibacterium sp. SC-1 TaxID=3135646 RepID=UPI00311D5261